MKIFNKIKRFLVISLLLAIHTQMQGSFRSGTIFTSNGDTITGFIDYQSNIHLAQKCRFKSDKNAKVIVYFPSDLNGFWFKNENRNFEKKTILDKNKVTEVFFELLVSGEVRLFDCYSQTGLSGHFFIQKANRGRLIDLPFLSQQTYVDNGYTRKLTTINSSDHIDSLKKYMKDVPAVWPKIEELSYPEKLKLIELVKLYNSYFVDENKSRIVETTKVIDDNLTTEKLVRGRLNLVVKTDTKFNSHFYLQKISESKLIEIPYSTNSKIQYNGMIINSISMNSTNHVDTLKKYMADAQPLFDEIDEINVPTKENLTKLVQEYNSYSDEKSYAAKHAVKRLPGNFYVTPGLFLSSYAEYTMFGGVYLSTGLINSNEHLFFNTGAFISVFREHEANTANNKYRVNTLLKVPLKLEYRFSNSLIQPRIAVGCNFYHGDTITVFQLKSQPVPVNFFLPVLSAGVSLKVSERITFSLMPELEFILKEDKSKVPGRYNNFSLFAGLQIML